MKKFLSILVAVFMLFALAACGNDTKDNEYENVNTPTSGAAESSNVGQEDVLEKTEGSDKEWREFLKDYEKWVDDYIVLVKKYNQNPTDMSILSDYTEMVSEMAEWSSKADDIELELKDTEEALEYSQELLRIASKLATID